MKKKSERAKLKRELDKIVAVIIRLRDDSTCQYCKKKVIGSNCHLSHVIPKSHGDILRWDLQNLMILCYHHHINWWHKNPRESGRWFTENFPERDAYLSSVEFSTAKFTETSLKEMLEKYRKLLTSSSD